jgi:hypothetical protein
VYPNPATDFFRFDLSANPTENIAGTLIITGAEGRLIHTGHYDESSGYCRLSPDMKPGMYLLQFTDNQGKVFRGLLLKAAR